MKLWLMMALLLFTVPPNGHDVVLEQLAKIERFAFGPTGYAGDMSEGEKDYRTVLERSTALADFEKLFTEGNIQAKCYALVGIHRLDAGRFNELARSLRKSDETVTTIRGCIVLRVPFTQILERIAADRY